ncbi:MAG: hypothetical protein ACPLXM_03650 [Bacteroidales bacterium]
MKTFRIILVLLVLLILIPFAGHLLWRFDTQRQMGVILVDKSVTDICRTSHLPFIWILNHLRFTKADGKPYDLATDYYGFLPLAPANSRNFEVKRIRLDDIEELSDRNDVLFYADTKGITYGEWFMGSSGEKKGSTIKIIGGLNQNDYLLLRNMYEKNKTVIAEHQFFSSASDPLVLNKTAEMFKIDYSYWHGRYFPKLDTAKNPELLPEFVVSYTRLYGQPWRFKGPGIIFIRGGRIVVLDQKDLVSTIPLIVTPKNKAREYNLPDTIAYPGWFEISGSGPGNEIFAEFYIPVNDSGKARMEREMIPVRFPAVIHSLQKQSFWYFTGDFSDCKIPYWTRKIKNWDKISLLHSSSPQKTTTFVWNYYIPLVERILDDTYKRMH